MGLLDDVGSAVSGAVSSVSDAVSGALGGVYEMATTAHGQVNTAIFNNKDLGSSKSGGTGNNQAFNVYRNMMADGGLLTNLNESSRYKGDDISNTSYSGSSTNVDLKGVWGLPYRFSDFADTRSSGENYGRVFLETFVGNGNFVSLRIGKPRFLPQTSSADSMAVVGNMMDGEAESLARNLSDAKADTLFKFEECMNEYWATVDLLVRAAAILLGVEKAGGIMDENFNLVSGDWGTFANKFLVEHDFGVSQQYSDKSSGSMPNEKGWADKDSGGSVWGSIKDTVSDAISSIGDIGSNLMQGSRNLMGAVVFYNDGPLEVGESIGNQTAPSSIAQMLNSIGGGARDLAKEAAFMTGYSLKVGAEKVASKDNNIESRDKSTIDTLTGLGDALVVNTSLPDVWKDSAYGKTYNLRFKFSTPYGNKLSIFKSVIVPTLHALVPVLPNQQGSSNTYQSPYLVNVMSRGAVNCLMGIVTQASITRTQSSLTIDGLPTEIEVVLTIQELNTMFALPSKLNTAGLMSTPGLLGFISSLCGINMEDLDLVVGRLEAASISNAINIKKPIRRKALQYMQNVYRGATSRIGWSM